MTAWHQLEPGAVAGRLGTDFPQGLTKADAERRLQQYGRNELIDRGGRSAAAILAGQLAGTMVLLLIGAAVVSMAIGDVKDAAAIGAIVILNAALGFWQEYRAERAMTALKQLAVPHAHVRRAGAVREIAAVELVPGDVLLLEAGNVIPADARVVEAANLRVQEAALTGESEAVSKRVGAIDGAELAVGDRRNMVFMGTAVAYGRGTALVTGTGMGTELGAIAATLHGVRREATPLQRRLDALGRVLALAALAIVALIFVLGVLRGEPFRLMFLTAISMAVAAVPEGLPAVVTIALALGGQRMLRRHALIRKLAAVETLGSVTVICSDKTGTLTENRMRVAVLDVPGRTLPLDEGGTACGRPDRTPGDLGVWGITATHDDGLLADGEASSELSLVLLLAGGALCSDATLRRIESGAEPAAAAPDPCEAIGDPTEAALVHAAARFGLRKDDLDRRFPRVAEVPFEAERKRMTTVHTLPGAWLPLEQAFHRTWADGGGRGEPAHVAFTKGAVDRLVDVCSRVLTPEGVQPLDESRRRHIMEAHDRLAAEGMRVLGVAFRPLGHELELSEVERDLVFVGAAAIVDPPRSEVQESIATCVAAGIRPIMITGDHPLTARYIARRLGIPAGERIVTGAELARLTPAELDRVVDDVAVYARVSPQHKFLIVEALQRRGHVVAMTGDGVNDAPALKKADIGVAMGITGTDVAKEAADAVLLDDNFATIVAAVEEGRIIYDNIRKFVRYLLTTNSSELWVMLVAPFAGMPLPLLPLQILWINLVTDGPTALTLGVEPAERGVMRRPPRPPGESVFAGGLGRHVIWVGMLMAALTLGAGYWYWLAGDERWQTVVFTTLAFAQMAHVLAIRSSAEPIVRVGVSSNPPLAAAVAVTIALQLALVYVAPLRDVFSTVPLRVTDLLLCAAIAAIVLLAVEAEKTVIRRRLAVGVAT